MGYATIQTGQGKYVAHTDPKKLNQDFEGIAEANVVKKDDPLSQSSRAVGE